jgi:GGDEF domain-containing protein
MAEVLKRICRSSDVVGRYGGDEFMAILPETDRRGATETANRLLAALAEERVFTRSGEQLPLAMSIGLAVAPDDSGHREELLACVDASLYQAKQSSGSSLVTHGEPLELVSSRDTPLGLFETLVRAVDMKDRYTRRHSQLDAEFAVELARAIGLSEGARGALRIAGLLHDVGIGVPDHVLEAGTLDAEERAVMQQHVAEHADIAGCPDVEDVWTQFPVITNAGTGYPAASRAPRSPSRPYPAVVAPVHDDPGWPCRRFRRRLAGASAQLRDAVRSGLVAAFVRALKPQRATKDYVAQARKRATRP